MGAKSRHLPKGPTLLFSGEKVWPLILTLAFHGDEAHGKKPHVESMTSEIHF